MTDQEYYDMIRSKAYHHCRQRLLSRYRMTLTLDLWLRMHNNYYTRNYDAVIEDPRGKLVVFECITYKFFGIFDPKFGVFTTFLDPKKGVYGTCRWRNGRVIEY